MRERSRLNHMEDLWPEIANAVAARRSLVAATVVRDSGSVPRRSGAKMLIFPDGTARGTIGGGVFEQRVIWDAISALARRTSTTHGYTFNSYGSPDETFGAVCGGRVE